MVKNISQYINRALLVLLGDTPINRAKHIQLATMLTLLSLSIILLGMKALVQASTINPSSTLSITYLVLGTITLLLGGIICIAALGLWEKVPAKTKH